MSKNPIHANPISDEQKQAIFNKSPLKTADDMLRVYIDIFVKQNRLRSCVSRPIFLRRILYALVYSLLLFLTATIYSLYHTGFSLFLFIMGLLVLPAIYIILILHNSVKNWLVKEVKKRPKDPIDNILASQVSGMKNGALSIVALIALPVVTLIAMTVLFWNPHLIYEKNDHFGYSVRYCTFAINVPDTIVIPETYKGRPVNEIRGSTFLKSGCKYIKLPSSLTEIRGNTFEGSSIRSIEIPDGVKRIGGSAFEDCYSLQTIRLPEGLEEIGGSAFRSCIKLEKVDLRNTSLVRIGTSAFRNCRMIERIELPPTVKTIGESAFRDCSRLKEFSVPSGASWSSKTFQGTQVKTPSKYTPEEED